MSLDKDDHSEKLASGLHLLCTAAQAASVEHQHRFGEIERHGFDLRAGKSDEVQ